MVSRAEVSVMEGYTRHFFRANIVQIIASCSRKCDGKSNTRSNQLRDSRADREV